MRENVRDRQISPDLNVIRDLLSEKTTLTLQLWFLDWQNRGIKSESSFISKLTNTCVSKVFLHFLLPTARTLLIVFNMRHLRKLYKDHKLTGVWFPQHLCTRVEINIHFLWYSSYVFINFSLRLKRDEERERQEKLARERLEAARNRARDKNRQDQQEKPVDVDTEDTLSLTEAIASDMDKKHKQEQQLLIKVEDTVKLVLKSG